MTRVTVIFCVLAALAAAGCSDRPVDAAPNKDAGVKPSPDAEEPFTCSPGKMYCHGAGGKNICYCDWRCDDTGTCYHRRPTPDEGGGWTCAWRDKYSYVCTKKGSKSSPPAKGQGWYCVWYDKEQSWKCAAIKVPVPGSGGPWSCKVDNAARSLTCIPKYVHPDPAKWSCKTVNGRSFCQKQGENGGLPVGGSNWKCNKASKNGVATWICYGEVQPGAAPPGQYGWNCKKVKEEASKETWRCMRVDGSGDRPPGGGYWACAKGTEFQGTLCEKVTGQPKMPPLHGGKCMPGTRMWCDGLSYGSWGQVMCQPNGKWATTMINGKQILDCQSLMDGRRPNTACACYHFYFNPNCCERPDCIVPTGSKGQLCKKSAGKLCDHCNPVKPECSGKDSKCLVTNSHETFCGTLCDITGDCPVGYKCLTVKLKVGTTKQCVPADYSCFY